MDNNLEHKWRDLFLSILLLSIITTINYKFGNDVGLSLFYLLPVFFVQKSVGKPYAFLFALLATFAWFAADVHHDLPTPNMPVSAWNAATRFFFFSLFILLLDMKAALERERYYSKRDFLTGIANRQAFYEHTHKILKENTSSKIISLAYVDCDNFKPINDTLGHDVGDQALRSVAKVLQEGINRSDIAARIGGDEFVVLLVTSDHRFMKNLVMTLFQQLNITMKNNQWPITFSIGVVTWVSSLPTVDDMIKTADKLMYSSKKTLKGNVVFENIK